MNRIATLLVALLMALGLSAQGNLSDNQRLLGHTVTDDIDINGAMIGTPGTYTVGAVLDSGVLKAYKGCRVVGIRLAAALDLGRTRVFLDNIAGQSMTQLQSKTQRVYQGWNEIFFNGDGYAITGDETLFYGFDYVETDDMVKAETGGIASTGQDTEGAFMILINDELLGVSNVGKLCVQLIVDVTNLPADNMTIGLFDTGFKYKRVGENVEVFSMVNNVGRDAVSSYRMGCRFDSCEPQYVDETVSLASGAQGTWQHTFAVPSQLQAGAHTVTVWVEKVNGTTLGYDADRAVTVKFATYSESMSRNGAYLEVYNDQNSAGASLLNPVTGDLDDETFVVNVHAPGTTLAVDDAAYIFNMYAYTRPSFTVNRSYFPGEKNIAYDMNDFLGLVDQSFLSAILQDIVAQDKTTVSFAGLELGTTYDPATRRLTVDARGATLPEAEAIYGQIAVTLMLVEDGVTAPQTVLNALNRPATNRSYIHDNVLRGYITAPYGSPLAISDNSYAATYTVTVPEGCDVTRLKVTGILTKAADSAEAVRANPRDYDIINVASAPVSAGAGIGNVSADSAAVEGYYNLQGRKVDPDTLVPGIYIRRYTDGHSDKTVIR